MNKRSKYILAGAAVVTLALALIVFKADVMAWFGSKNPDVLRSVIKPTKGTFKVTVTATGELQAKNSIKIYGPTNATAAGIWQLKLTNLVDEGTVVNEGDIVAELDKSDLSSKVKEVQLAIQKAESQFVQAQLDTTLSLSQARDDLINLEYAMEEKKIQVEQSTYEAPSVRRQAEIDHERSKRSYKQAQKNYSTKRQQSIAKIKEAEADLATHQSKLDSYMRILNQLTIRAPAGGMVIYDREWNGRKRVVGSTISAWNPVVATLPDLNVMESVTYVNEIDIQKINQGLSVNIALDADPDKKLTGTISHVANVGEQRPNSDAKVFEVKILVSESDTTLRPSMTTSNEIIVTTIDNALFIPLECIHSEEDLTFVYKMNGSGVIKQEVVVGIMNDNEAIVEQGLAESDEVFLSVPDDNDQLEMVFLEQPMQSEQQASR